MILYDYFKRKQEEKEKEEIKRLELMEKYKPKKEEKPQYPEDYTDVFTEGLSEEMEKLFDAMEDISVFDERDYEGGYLDED